MDRVICDYDKQYNRIKSFYPNMIYPQSLHGFFSTLEPIDGAIDGVNLLRKYFDVYILTRPSIMNPISYTEKRIWIENNFDLEFCEKLILCPNKSLLNGDFLIDDFKHDFKGTQLLFGSTEYENWKRVLKFFNV
jgi:5'(3')-deoxyribonucleotidase